jgi:hypothetical protein
MPTSPLIKKHGKKKKKKMKAKKGAPIRAKRLLDGDGWDDGEWTTVVVRVGSIEQTQLAERNANVRDTIQERQEAHRAEHQELLEIDRKQRAMMEDKIRHQIESEKRMREKQKLRDERERIRKEHEERQARRAERRLERERLMAIPDDFEGTVDDWEEERRRMRLAHRVRRNLQSQMDMSRWLHGKASVPLDGHEMDEEGGWSGEDDSGSEWASPGKSRNETAKADEEHIAMYHPELGWGIHKIPRALRSRKTTWRAGERSAPDAARLERKRRARGETGSRRRSDLRPHGTQGRSSIVDADADEPGDGEKKAAEEGAPPAGRPASARSGRSCRSGRSRRSRRSSRSSRSRRSGRSRRPSSAGSKAGKPHLPPEG